VIFVSPLYELAMFNVSVPAPCLVRANFLPLAPSAMAPLKARLAVRLAVSVVVPGTALLSVMTPPANAKVDSVFGTVTEQVFRSTVPPLSVMFPAPHAVAGAELESARGDGSPA